MNRLKISFKPKNVRYITKEPNKTSELMITTIPGNSMSAADSTSSNASHSKSRDICFQNSICQNAEIMWGLKHNFMD